MHRASPATTAAAPAPAPFVQAARALALALLTLVACGWAAAAPCGGLAPGPVASAAPAASAGTATPCGRGVLRSAPVPMNNAPVSVTVQLAPPAPVASSAGPAASAAESEGALLVLRERLAWQKAEQAHRHETERWLMIAAFTLACVGLALAVWALMPSWAQPGIALTSHWGGFGGTSGGWQLSPRAGRLVVALAAWATAFALAVPLLGPPMSDEPAAPKPAAGSKP